MEDEERKPKTESGTSTKPKRKVEIYRDGQGLYRFRMEGGGTAPKVLRNIAYNSLAKAQQALKLQGDGA